MFLRDKIVFIEDNNKYNTVYKARRPIKLYENLQMLVMRFQNSLVFRPDVVIIRKISSEKVYVSIKSFNNLEKTTLINSKNI